jgi:hypothetical protein
MRRSMSEIDWLDTALEAFGPQAEFGEDGKTTGRMVFPHGDGAAQRVMLRLQYDVEWAYSELIGPEDVERFESAGEVPVIRASRRGYERLKNLTLKDLPAVLDTLVVLEEERGREEAEERERKTTERKERERVRAKERRMLKKLGEW